MNHRRTTTVKASFTVFWVVAWLIMGLPPVHRWDAALLSLFVALILDVLAGLEAS